MRTLERKTGIITGMERASIKIEIPLATWKEEDQYVVWTPALDLSSYGDTEETALQHFAEALNLFFETALERNNLEQLLEEFGWEQVENNWRVPFQPLENSRSFTADVPLPAAA